MAANNSPLTERSPGESDQSGPLLLELGRAITFLLSMLSLYPLLVSAFFQPGTYWRERIVRSLLYIVLAGCSCLISGILFSLPNAREASGESLLRTLPVRLFLWTLSGMVLLFLLCWYLDENFAPLMRHNCCRP